MEKAPSLREDPLWADIKPIEQDDGPVPVVRIKYSDDFREVMDYFRAILRAKEYSARALNLTERVIALNPGNYTAWAFRRECLQKLGFDVEDEYRFTERAAEQNPKNYQIWFHRQSLADSTGCTDGEKSFIDRALSQDSKNYHAWSYRQWLITKFDLFDQELEFCDRMLKQDIRNNSAWNHRFLVTKHQVENSGADKDKILEAELKESLRLIRKAPNSESGWNYMRGILLLADGQLDTLAYQEASDIFTKYPACPYAAESIITHISSRPSPSQDEMRRAIELCEMLATKIDTIRVKYWRFRKEELQAQLAKII